MSNKKLNWNEWIELMNNSQIGEEIIEFYGDQENNGAEDIKKDLILL